MNGDEGTHADEEPELPGDPDPDGLLADLLGAPDRDRCPGARPVVAVTESDPPEFIQEVQERSVALPTLQRRGQDHGAWAELHDSFGFFPQEPLPRLAERWEAARPIVLHDALPDSVMELVRTDRRHEQLGQPDGLRAWIEERLAHLEPDFEVLGDEAAEPLTDERDLARVPVAWRGDKGPEARDLWIKSQTLSTHADDASLRVRFSFGKEIEDDASRDGHRHQLVAQLAERMVPELGALHRDGELRGLLGEWMRGRPLLTQAICYWNAPNGGALFHHDAFEEPLEGRQRGVVYAQLTGSTAWLALSLDDLALRVREFLAATDEQDDDPVSAEKAAAGAEYPTAMTPELRSLVDDDARLKAELASPGCGRLAHLVNDGGAFTAFLADAGHGYMISEGDIIVLPNHGLTNTCMHSVFCASDETAFSLSLALRESSPTSGGPRGGKGRSRRRRGHPRGRKGQSQARRRGRSGTSSRGPGSSRRRS